MAVITDVASATRDTVGRYFSLVSALPSAVLAIYVFVLVASGAWSHQPRFGRAFHALATLSLGEAAALLLLSLAGALAFHPLQFAMVQVLEGYWGSGPVVVWIRAAFIGLSRRRFKRLQKRNIDATLRLQQDADELAESRSLLYYALLSRRDETIRLLAEMPSADEIMPTRLGNVLRFYERAIGAPYDLDAVLIMPYLSRIASSDDMAYVDDQRSNLDLAVRMSLTSTLAAALWILFFWRHPLWLLAVLVPIGLAYISYRGAVVAAAEYGRALAVIIALNRFMLYERLHLQKPATAAAERRANRILNRVLSYSPAEAVAYVHSSVGTEEQGSAGTQNQVDQP